MSVARTILNRILRPAARRSVEAAGGGRRWAFSPAMHAPQGETLAARQSLMQRARAATINQPLAARVIATWESALAARSVQAMPKHPDRELRGRLADDFEAIVNEHLVQVVRGVVRDGESLLRIVADDAGRLRLQWLDPEQLDATMTQDLGGGRRIIAGVELDPADRPVAFHLLRDPPGSIFGAYSPAVRVPAADVLHIFDRLLPGQTRGISWFAPILLKLAEHDRTSDAMLVAVKTQSLLAGFVTDPSGEAGGFAAEGTGATVTASLEPGTLHVLPTGAQITFSNPGTGLAQASEFLKAQTREIAAGGGLTYEQVSTDLAGANYSSARVGLMEFRRRVQLLHRTLIVDQLLAPLWRRFIDAEVLAGRLSPDPELYRVTFAPPGFDWIDPRREVEAEVAAIAASLKSRREVIASRGRDADDVDAEIASDTARQTEATE